jgi:hypothetical protein
LGFKYPLSLARQSRKIKADTSGMFKLDIYMSEGELITIINGFNIIKLEYKASFITYYTACVSLQMNTCAPNVEKIGTQLYCFNPRTTSSDSSSHGFLAISFVYTKQNGN